MSVRAVVILVVLLAGCTGPADTGDDDGAAAITQTTTPARPTREAIVPPAPAFGVAFSPRSFGASDFSAFFDEAQAVGDVVLWGGAPEELASSDGAPHVIAALARQKGLAIAVQVSYVSAAGEKPWSEVDQANWRKEVVGFVTLEKPRYLALGVELDRFSTDRDGFMLAYSAWFNATYDAVKEASPDTLVFVTYQYEHVRGYTGGLYGGPERGSEMWHLLDLFAKADLVAFTTYPGLVFQDAGAFPLDHYSAIRAHTDKPVAFTEVGHFALLEGAPGWASSPEEQAAFARRFHEATADLRPELVVWLHLHDQLTKAPRPFQYMGLIDKDGAKRPAYDAWIAGQ